MRQRALPVVSPPRPPAVGESLLSHRRNRSAENNSGNSISSWEITRSPNSDAGKQDHILHYSSHSGYQNHHRKHVALQNVHLFYRKPLHVSDANYRAFVGLPKSPTSSMISRQSCLGFCAGFSWVAVGFFLFVYIILRYQPLYIPHSLSYQYVERNGRSIKVSDLSHSPLTGVAWRTMLAYLFVAVVCQYYAKPNRWRKQRYQDIPDHHHRVSGIDPTLPTAIPIPIDVYQDSLWERTVAGFKQWMLVKGYRRGKRKQFATKTV